MGNPLSVDTTTPDGHDLKSKIDQHHKNQQQHKDNKTAACGHIIGQCTQAMKNELEAREDWASIEDNMVETLKAIKEIGCNHQSTKCCIGTLSKVIKDHFTIRQEDNEPSVTFAKCHKTTQDSWKTNLERSTWKKPSRGHPNASSHVTAMEICWTNSEMKLMN